MSQTQQTQTGQITLPVANSDTLGNIQQLLASNLGKEAVAEFFLGANAQVTRSGILTAVGLDYLVLYDDVNLTDIVCDICTLQFVTFYLPGTRPRSTTTDNTASARLTAESRDSVATMAALNYAKRKSRKLE